jgi:hypothetical protein
MGVAYFGSDTLTGIRTPLCWTQLPTRRQELVHAVEDTDGDGGSRARAA